jgi:pimeloyl-ACP methyl ester carboxylesterase
MYEPVSKSSTQKLNVRGIEYAVHCWGNPNALPVFALHGWADSGLSFQFLADALCNDCYLIAPDWRGFGDSAWNLQGYWFPDYLADLDVLLEHYSPDKPVTLLGHSMGGNVACLYAGSRPKRVSRLISMDVFGIEDTNPSDAPHCYEKWMQQIREQSAFSSYEKLEQLIEHIKKLAPGIDKKHAEFIAISWSQPSAEGNGFTIKADPAHKKINPVLYRREEARACWSRITASTLFIFGEDSRFFKSYFKDGFQQECQQCFQSLTEKTVSDAGHMLHLQQPEKLAEILTEFLRD